MFNLSKNVKVTILQAHTTAGTDAIESDEIYMDGFESVMFLTNMGTANAGNYIKIQQDTATGMASAADLEGTKVVQASDGAMIGVDVVKPKEGYLRVYVTRTEPTTCETIWAIQYNGRKSPVTNTGIELHVTPDEGTA